MKKVCLVFLTAVFFTPQTLLPYYSIHNRERNGLLMLTEPSAIKTYAVSQQKSDRTFDNARFIRDVNTYVQNGCDINTLDADGNNTLMRLVTQVNREFFDKPDITASLDCLSNAGIDVNQRDRSGQTVLFMAYEEIIPYLINHGADLSVTDYNGNTLLHHYRTNPYRCTRIRALAEKCVSFNAVNDENATPLMALFKNDGWNSSDATPELVRYYLSRGALVASADKQGLTALHYAVYSNNPDGAKTLLENKAPVDAQSTIDGNTPLLLAVELDRNEIVKLLLAAGADVDKQNRVGLTPRIAAYVHRNAQIPSPSFPVNEKLLTAKNTSFSTTPHDAERFNNPPFEHYQSLIEYFACNACRYGNIPLLAFLVKHGVSFDSISSTDRTPLMIAAAFGKLEAVQYLLANKADPQKKDSRGLTAFWHALQARPAQNLPEILAQLRDKTKENEPLSSEEYSIIREFAEMYNSNCEQAVKTIPFLGAYVTALQTKDVYETEKDKYKGVETLLKKKIPLYCIAQVYNSINIDISSAVELDDPILELITRYGPLTPNDEELETATRTGTSAGKKTRMNIIFNNAAPFRGTPLATDHNAPLTHACLQRKILLIDFILGKGYPVDHFETWNYYEGNYETASGTALMHSSATNKPEIIKHLIQKGANVNAKNRDGCSALHFASQYGKPENLTCLIRAKASIDARDNNGVTPLMLASENGHIAAMKLLIDNKANVNATDNGGWTPLMWACYGGNPDAVTLLISRGAQINHHAPDGLTAMMIARLHCRVDIINLLKNSGALFTAHEQPAYDRYRLLQAAGSGNYKLAKELLAKKIPVNAQDSTGRTALFLAAANGHISTTTLLLDAGASPDVPDYQGITPLIAASNNMTAYDVLGLDTYKRIINELIAHNASVDKPDPRGNTPLFYAVAHYHQNIDLLNLLIRCKANTGHVNNAGMTVLHEIAKQFYWYEYDQSKISLTAFASLDPQTSKGITPLMLAACNTDNTIFLSFLLAHGANANIKDVHGFTALDYALYYENYPAVITLLPHTAQISPDAYYAAASYSLFINDYATAYDFFKKAFSGKTDLCCLLGAAETSLRLGNYKESYTYLTQGLNNAPKQPDFLYMLASWYSLNGTPEKSIPLLQQALQNGYRYPNRILYHPDLEAARKLKTFEQVRKLAEKKGR